MEFKMPDSGYLYIIQRVGSQPFDGSKFELFIDSEKYDVVPSNKSYTTEGISDIIINLDTKCFDKVNPGKELQYADTIGKQLGIELNQLLMG